jgi:hypothetical protein
MYGFLSFPSVLSVLLVKGSLIRVYNDLPSLSSYHKNGSAPKPEYKYHRQPAGAAALVKLIPNLSV